MDEIDAALDFRNVSIVANYIKVSWLQEKKHDLEIPNTDKFGCFMFSF